MEICHGSVLSVAFFGADGQVLQGVHGLAKRSLESVHVTVRNIFAKTNFFIVIFYTYFPLPKRVHLSLLCRADCRSMYCDLKIGKDCRKTHVFEEM